MCFVAFLTMKNVVFDKFNVQYIIAIEGFENIQMLFGLVGG
jgi:hypothetical protein